MRKLPASLRLLPLCVLAGLLLAAPGLLRAVEPPAAAAPPAVIPFDQLGAHAGKNYSGDALAVTATAEGARLRCDFQRLAGTVGADGLWLHSTAANASGTPFRVRAATVGREVAPGGALAGVGTVEVGSVLARWARPGLVEEFSVGVDGVRQDFLVAARPTGTGALRVELTVDGAKAEATAAGVQLVLDCGRKLIYGQLKVVDANGRELAARMEVLPVGDEVTSLTSTPASGALNSSQRLLTSSPTSGRLAVLVEDADAAYPVRIDPTFTDADWLALNTGVPGVLGTASAIAADAAGNVYVGGFFYLAGDVLATNVAKWNGTAWSALGPGLPSTVLALAVDSAGNVYAGLTNRVTKWDGSSWTSMGTPLPTAQGLLGPQLPRVLVIRVEGADIYAAGDFNGCIAKWNGTDWATLGGGVKNDDNTSIVQGRGGVSYIAVVGTSVYVSGNFTRAGAVPLTFAGLARWNGTTWVALGGGAPSGFTAATFAGSALAASSTDLFVRGTHKWNGTAWSALGTGTQNPATSLAVDAAGNLYASGFFASAGGVNAASIAKWNGTSWSALGSGLSSTASALVVDASGNLYQAGTGAVGVPGNVSKWNGTSWSAMGQGLNSQVSAVVTDATGNLYVGGSFTSAGPVSANYVAKWDGSAWFALGSGVNSPVYSLAVDNGGNLYVGGDFTMAGGVTVNRVARWNGTAWFALGTGVSSTARALAVDGTGNLHVGGDFTKAGGVTANYVAKWEGNVWSALGTGMNGKVNAMAFDSTGNLLAAGNFTSAGGTTVNRVARWNGSTWSAFGAGVGPGVNALTLDASGNLYVGGGGVYMNQNPAPPFDTVNTPFGFVARWDGANWVAVAIVTDEQVYALLTAGSDIIAGGAFTTIGGIAAKGIAKYDGTAWSPLGAGVTGGHPGLPSLAPSVRALTERSGRLYVGGFFATVGTNTVSPHLAQAKLGPPIITSVVGPVAGGYKVGATLTFTVTYGGPVTATGTPQLALTIGSTTRQANLVPPVGGAATNVLTFTYTVQPGDSDPDGIALTSPLTLNGGSITAGGQAAGVAFTPPATTAVLVDTVPPTVLSVVRLNPGPQLLAAGTRQVVFRVTYSEAVTNVIPAGFSIVNVGGGTVTGTIGTPAGGPTVYDVPVTITGGSGEFRLQPVGAATDFVGNGLANVPFVTGETYLLPATEPGAPLIVTAQGTTNGSYGLTRVLTFTVGFNVNVTVTGVPQLPLVFESGTRAASYVAGSGGPSLVFQYTPQAPDTDTNGLAFTFPLALNGGTIQAAGVNAALGFIAVNDQPGVFVDTTPPAVVIGAPNSNSTSFGPVSYVVTYSDASALTVTLTNADLTLNKTGDADAQLLVSGTGTNRTVTLTNITGFNGTLGISLAAGTAVDAAGNPAPAAGPSTTFIVQRPPNAAPSFVFGFNIVSTLAGTGAGGSVDGPGAVAEFKTPVGLKIDGAGNLYVADTRNNRIRKVTPAGVVTTIAGSTSGFADGTGTAAQFDSPQGVAVDGAGNVYVADRGNHRIRKVTSAGVVTTLAGSTAGFADGTGTAAKFTFPRDVAVDSAGNVYVADESNHRIRKVTSAGKVTTLAGGTEGFADGTGTAAKFAAPVGVDVDSAGNVYVADVNNHRIRKVTPAGVVTTLAGSGTRAFADGIGAAASFILPQAVFVDGVGNVYVADTGNNRIRKVTPSGGVTTVAGSISGFAEGTGAVAQFRNPRGVAVDSAGNVYAADSNNERIRKITPGEVTVAEDAGPQTIPNIALNILADPVAVLAAEQKVTFTVVSDNPALFAVAPAISTDGTLTFTSATNAHGTATVTVTAMDDGGTANGGVDTSAPQTFTLTITPVNDAPNFSFVTNVVVVLKTASAISSNAFLVTTSFSPGPADESAQTRVGNYTVTTDITGLFATGKAPAIDSATGKLTFTPKSATTTGLATVSVVAQDSGGTANGGVDKRTNTFTIALVDKNTAPSFDVVGDPAAAGLAWSARETARQWTSIASSSNGMVLVATAESGNIFVSTNAGVTWTSRESARDWNGVASSADGKQLVAVVDGGKVYVSADFGATWTAKDSSRTWSAVASSADGAKLVAAVRYGQIYVSANSGGKWNAKDSARAWNGVASSADGVKLAAVDRGGTIYTSVNSGGTWTASTGGLPATAEWTGIASSADGQKLAAVAQAGQIYTSADGGTNWTAREAVRGWTGVSSSADGTRLAAAASGGKIYLSIDSGETWGARDSGRNWGAIAMSADGTRLAATVFNGQIYVSGPTVVVDENSGPFSLPGFATSINPGLPQESYQSVGFTVTNDAGATSALYSSQPALAADGTLTFTPALNAVGTTFFRVTAQDDGGTAGGGVDTSAEQLLTIIIRPVPKITDRAVTGGSGTRTDGNVLSVTVQFDRGVSVTGTPALALVVGDRTVAATYASNISPTKLVFNYTVQPGDVDNDGVAVQSPVRLEGGSIKDAASGANASLNFMDLVSGAKVDAVRPTVTISAPSVLTASPGTTVSYTVTIEDIGAGLDVTGTSSASFKDKVKLNRTGTATGILSVGNAVPDLARKKTVKVSVLNNNGSGTLGISLDFGMQFDLAGNATLAAGPSATFEVSNTPPPAPVIFSVMPPTDSTNKATRLLDFKVKFSAVVNVTGTPKLTLDIGGTPANANYIAGTGTDSLTFRHGVSAGNDLDGITVASPVVLFNGTIKSTAGVDALLTFDPPAMHNVKVDTTIPTLTVSPPSLASTSTGPVTYTLTYADNMAVNSISLRSGSLLLRPTGDANGTATVSGTGNTRTVTISDITGNGTLSIIVLPSAFDFAGNGDFGSLPSTAFNVVNSGTQTITFAQPNAITYGDVAVTNLTATASSGLPVAFEILSGPGTLSDGTNVTITGAGVIRIKATQAGDTMIGAARPEMREIGVGTKALTVIAANATRAYGQPNPTFTVSFTGFVGTDTVAQLTGAAGISTTATSTSAPGTYPITPTFGSLGSDNYTFGTFTPGTLTVTKATATVTLADLAQVYSGGVKSATATTVPAGLTVDFSYTGARINAGNYPVTATLNDANYQGTVSDTLVIAKAPQTITFTLATSATYGDAAITLNGMASSTLPVTYAVTGPATLAGGVLTITGAGTVQVTASQAGDANFLAATAVSQTLTVGKKALIATAANATRAVGAADPAFTVNYSGFVGTDTAAVLDTAPTVTSAANTMSVAGGYTLTAAGGADDNYTFTYVPGTLTVSSGMQTITFAQPNGITYGDVATTNLTATASSMLGVAFEILSGPGTVSGNTLTLTGAGTIRIKATQSGDTTHSAAAPVIQELLVAKKALTVTAADASRAYGQANPTFTAGFTGFVGTDTATQLEGAAGLGTTATALSAPGPYAITPTLGSLSSTNYTFATFTPGTLTVTKATATVTLADLAHVYSGSVKSASATTQPAGLTVNLSYTGARINAGNYPVTGTIDDANYQGTASDTLVIAKAPQTITFAPPPSNVPLKDLATVALAATSSSALTVTLTMDAGGAATLNNVAGSYSLSGIGTTGMITLRANQPGDANYLAATEVVRTLNVEKNNQTITFAALTDKVFGNAAFTLTATADSALAVTYTVVSGPATVSGDQLTITGTGEVKVRASQAGNTTFNPAADVDRTFTVGKANQTLTFADFTGITYGAAAPTLGATADSMLAVTYTVLSGPATVSGSVLTITGAGEVIVQASQPGNANYSAATSVSKTLTVAKKALTATVANATRPVGAADPAFVVNYTGFVGSETVTVLDTPPTVTTTATSASPANTYPLTAAGGVDNNYSFTYVAGTLTVSQTAQTITFGALSGVTYGSGTVALAATASSGLTVTYTVVSGPGTVSGNTLTITGAGPIVVEANQAGNATYSAASAVQQSLAVAKKALTLVAANAGRVYGQANPTFSGTLAGFVNGDTVAVVSGAAAFATTADLNSAPGTYPITATVGTLSAANYSFATFVPATLTITKATATVTLANLAHSYNGAVKSATAATTPVGLTVNLTYTGARIEAGSYPVTGTIADANYEGSVSGTLVIGKASQTITFADFTAATYGNAALTLGATADSSLAVTYTVLSGPATVSGSTLTITGAGDVLVQASQPGNANYNAATSVSKTLTVAKKALTATVANAMRQVGAADPAFTVNYTGLVGTDTKAVLDIQPTVTTTATSASPVGTYPLTAAGGVDNNYSFSYVAGTLTIGLVPQTITFAQPAEQTLGGTPLTLAATASSGLTVSYTVVSGPAVLGGNVLSFSGTGAVTVRATQVGNGTFDAASAVERTFNVNPAPNAAPTALVLSANTVLENLASGTTVGTLTVTDPNLADTHTYTLVSGAGSADNAAFTIAGNVLQTAAAFDFETKASYALRVRVTDNGTLFFEQPFTVTVVDVNEAPVVTLAQTAVRVNQGSGTFSQSTFATFANGPATEAGQSLLGYTVTVDNAALFSAAPALTASGTLTFTPAANATGTATVTVTARDTGGTVNGGVDTSAARTFTINIVVPPAVFSVTPVAGNFRVGQTVTVTVAFTAPVTLTGTMELPLTVGATARVATGATVTDGTNVVFSYVVQAGDTDLDGLTLASPFTLASGTLRDATGVDALLNFNPPATTGVLVDTTVPTVTISAPSVANTMGGPVTFTVTYADSAFNASTLSAADITLNRTGDANGTVTVAGSGNTRTVSISGITGNGTLGISLAAGTASDLAGNLAPAAGPSATFTVFNFLPQTVTFGALPGKTYGDAAFALGATASSSLPVTYTVVSGPATVSGGTLTLTGAGTVLVRASQPGDATFSAATSVEQNFGVAKKALTVTAGNAMRAYGVANPSFTATLSGFVNGDLPAVVSGLAGLSSAATPTSAPGNYDITPSVGSLSAANYTFATFTAGTLTVSKAAATVTLTELAHTYNGSVKSAVAVTQPAGLTVNVGYTGTRINAGNYPVTAVIADANYEGSAGGTLVIAKAAQTITFAPPRNQVPLKELVSSPLSATASSSLPVTLALDAGSAATLTGAAGSYSLTGIGQTGTVTIRANQPGDANYLPAEEVVRLVDVTKNNQIITFPAVSAKTFGDADVTLMATSDSALAVNYLLVSGPAILNNGVLKLTGAGEVRVRASQPGNATFNAAADVEMAFTVGKANQTITFGAFAAAIYGDANLTLAASASSGLALTYSVVSGPATVTGGVLTIAGAGSVVVQASQPGNENYNAAPPQTQTLTVAKKTLTVTVANASRAVGAPDPVFTVSYAGFVRGDTAAVLDVPPTVTSSANSTSVAGNYPLTAAGGADNNYDFSYVAGSLAVNQSSQTITFGTLAGKTYGDAPVVLAAIASSGQPVTYRVVSGNATVSGNTLTVTGAGEVVVEATQAGNDKFSAAPPVTQSFAVAKKALTVVAQDARRAFGQANPTFTASYNGFVGTDTVAVLGGAPGLGTTADSASAPGTYSITPTLGSLSAANYNFAAFTPGTLTVTKAAATVTLADLAHVYSGSAKSATATTQPAGLTVNLSYTGARINAGSYPVTAAIADANYEGSVSDTLVIAKAPQTITFAPPASSVPLKDLSTIALAATASSTLPVTLTLDPGSAATLTGTSGSYSLTGIGTTGTVTLRANQPGDDNYLPATEVLRTLDVTKNNQTITFTALPGKIFGDQPITLGATADSSLAVSYTVVSGNATVSGNVLTITGAGDVVVHASQPGSATFNAAADVERTFTVGKAPQTILFGPLADLTYGDAPITLAASVNSPLTVTYNVTGPATVSGNTLTITGAGSVVIQAVQAGNENYSAATPVTQTLTVAKRELTATVANAARAVGAPDPQFTVSYTGFAGSETEAVLDTPPTVTSTANSASPAGTYPLAAAGGVDNNYRFTYVAGSLVLSQTPQDITFGTLLNRTYGDAPVVLAATASSGLPVSYTVSGSATVSGNVLTITGAGTIEVVANQSGNVAFSAAAAVTQTFSVAKKALVVTAANTARAYGVANPVFTATLAGFVNGDPFAVVSGTPVFTTSATSASAPGGYPITVAAGTLAAANYSFDTFVPATLTVTKATATVTLAGLAHTYDGTPKAATATTEPAGLTVNVTYAPGTPLNAGSYTVTATIVDSRYEGSTTGTLVVSKAAQVITFAAPPSNVPLASLATVGLTATSSSGLSVTLTLDAGSAATLVGSPGNYALTGLGAAGPVTLRANQPGNDNYLPATEVVRALDVTRNNQAITFAALAGKVFGDAAITLGAAADSSLPVSFSLVSGPATLVGNVLTFTGAGEVRVRASQAGNASFNAAADVDQTFTVAKAPQVITFASLAARTYGAAAVTLSASADSGLPVSFSIVSGPANLNGNVLTLTGAGNVVVQASQGGDANYLVATAVQRTLVVGKKVLTVTATDATRRVGAANPTFTFTATGYVGTDTAGVLDTPPTVSTSATVTSAAGDYPLTSSGGVDDSYEFAYVAGKLVITQVPQTITFNALPGKTYGDAVVGLGATASSGLPVAFTIVSGPGTLSGTNLTLAGAGTIVVQAAQAGDLTNAAAASVTQELVVAKKALVIGVQDEQRSYGQPNPGFTATFTGFVSPDTAAALNGSAGFTTTATATSAPGPYPITPSVGSLSSTNYAFATFNPGTLTVSKAAATVTLADLVHTYSGTAKSATATTVPAGLTVNLVQTGARVDAGNYPVTATIADANYEGSATDTLLISPASQTITYAPLPSSVPLKDLASVVVAATASSGLPVTLTLDGGSAATLSGTVGNYSLTAIGQTGTVTLRANQAGNGNYFVADEVVRTIDVTKNNQSIRFGVLPGVIFGTAPIMLAATADSGLDVTYELVSGQATVSGNVLTISGAGDVIVRAKQAGSATFNAAADVERTFTVGKANQTITFATFTGATYGDAALTLGATADSSLAVTYTVVSGPATLNGGELTITGAGDVVVQATQPGNDNYSVASAVTRTLTIAKKGLAATVADAARQVGASDPTFTITYAGFITGDNGLGLKVPPTVTSAANSASAAGDYALTAAGGADDNYTFSYVAGKLVISQVPQTITFGVIATRTFGDPLLVLAATASSGLPVSYSVVSGPATVSGSEVTISAPGVVTLRATQVGNVTYSAATAVEQTFTVNPPPNSPPTAVSLFGASVLENQPAGTVAGALTATDPNAGDTHTFTLVSGAGDADNAAFTIVGNELRTAGGFNFEAKSSYSVRVRATDAGGLTVEQTFTVTVLDVNEAPIAANNNHTMNQGDTLTVPTATGVLANDSDPDQDALTATLVATTAQGTLRLNPNGSFAYTPASSFFGTDAFTYRATDGALNSATVTVNISVIARPTNAVPSAQFVQKVFSGAILRFSATNLPTANALHVGDPDSTTLTVSLTVTNGTLLVSQVNGLLFANGQTNGTNLILSGLTADVNAALESLAYTSKTNYFGDDTLAIVTTDEGGRTNRSGGTVAILVEIPTLGGVPKVSLEGLNDAMTGRMITNVTGLAMDTNLVQGITYDRSNSVVNVLPVGGQDGSTNRSTITVRVRFNDGTVEDVVVPVIIYQPLLAATTNAGGTYNSSFGTPLFNYQTSLYEQKVRVQNNTPFDFTALRITATNLPATVTLQNATLTNGGQVYIDYNLPILSGSNVTLKLEYFSSDLRTFTPGLKLELLNTTRTNTAPPGAVMTSVAPKTGYAPDGLVKNYLYFPSTAGQRYYVQYFDTVTVPQVWKTSGVVIQGTGLEIHWMDDGPPSTETPPGPLRFYRVVTDR